MCACPAGWAGALSHGRRPRAQVVGAESTGSTHTHRPVAGAAQERVPPIRRRGQAGRQAHGSLLPRRIGAGRTDHPTWALSNSCWTNAIARTLSTDLTGRRGLARAPSDLPRDRVDGAVRARYFPCQDRALLLVNKRNRGLLYMASFSSVNWEKNAVSEFL
jgi:hypothetical protein